MSWEVENADEFGSWFVELSETDQDAVDERLLPVADELYDVHLKELKQEGLLK